MSTLVLACNFCANNQLHQRWWLLGAVSLASLVLVVELVVAMRTLESAPSPLRFGLNGLIGVALLVGAIGSLTAPVLGALAFLSVLTVRALVVAGVTLRKHPRAVNLRLAVTSAALVVCVLLSVPASRSRDELVTLLTGTPYQFDQRSWAFTQLEADDGLAEVEQRLERLNAQDPRAVVTLELHQQLGGLPARRSALCSGLSAEPRASVAQRIERVCGNDQRDTKP